MVVPFITTSSISREPPDIKPVVVTADDPVLIVPNPDVIEPESSAPVLTRLGMAVISSSKYAARSVTATCTIVPLSLKTTLSASATVVEVAEVFPSIIFSSAVVTEAPSSISNSVSVIAAEPMVNPVAVIVPLQVSPVSAA